MKVNTKDFNKELLIEKLKSYVTNNASGASKIRNRRHSVSGLSSPDHMDMRDFLPTDVYHRYDTIIQYLEVLLAISHNTYLISLIEGDI